MTTIKKYLSLVKFSHTIFAMPFAMIGFFLGVQYDAARGSQYQNNAFQHSYWFKLLLVIICMVTARSAAMAFNRWLDKNFDAKNPRTAIREIPSGIIHANNALIFVIINCILFIIACWFINPLCFYLSFVALFVILFYSYTKRFTALCHLVLGVGLSLAPIGAFLAVTGEFALLPILFSFAVLFWVSGFDIIYALQDEEFDKNNQLHSIPAALGKRNALRVSDMLHFLSAICVITAGTQGGFGWWYAIGAFIFIGMLIYQHSIVKPNDLSKVNIAFMTANGIASIVFAVFALADLFLTKNSIL
ncbi:MAG: UbiA family prenyltransferase [Bacteroidetes bacterium]|nr:UbiA family prenyltransferase [Bacteroidota bacterium]